MSQPIPAPLKKALTKLLQIKWQFGAKVRNPKAQSVEWECYQIGLRDQHYGRQLSELEEEYERAKWLRSQCMFPHLDRFKRLLDAAFAFVVELTEAGGQRILGERAGLPLLKKSARPSEWIQFGPVLPPNPPPLQVSEYEEGAGGPHVLGARLLWWCAAAKHSKEFGFSRSFSQSLWTQPIWITSQGWVAEVNGYPISLIKETASETVNLLVTGSVADSLSDPEQSDAELADGPHPINQFRWKDKLAQLTNSQWQLVDYIWKTRYRRAHYDDLIERFWGEKAEDSAVETAASRTSQSLKKQGIPVRLRLKARYVCLAVEES